MSAVDSESEKYATLRNCATLGNCHEEADTIMIQHVVKCATKKPDAVIHVRCNDTDAQGGPIKSKPLPNDQKLVFNHIKVCQ